MVKINFNKNLFLLPSLEKEGKISLPIQEGKLGSLKSCLYLKRNHSVFIGGVISIN